MKKTVSKSPHALFPWLILLVLFALFLLGLLFVGIAQGIGNGITFFSADNKLQDGVIIVLILLLFALVGLIISLIVSLSRSFRHAAPSKTVQKSSAVRLTETEEARHEKK